MSRTFWEWWNRLRVHPPMKFGTDTYRAGALERLQEAELLMRTEQFVGSVYLGGLAVEGMLRSLLWQRDRSFDERHDLRRLASKVSDLGLLRRDTRDDEFIGTVSAIAAWWRNELRFAGREQALRWFRTVGAMDYRDSRSLKAICHAFFERCSTVLERCDLLWQRQQPTRSRPH